MSAGGLDILIGGNVVDGNDSDFDTDLEDFSTQPCTAQVTVKQEDRGTGEELDSDEETIPRSSEATEHIEDLVIQFLTQLSRPLFSENEGVDDPVDEDGNLNVKPRSNRIEIQLADRKKVVKDGSAGFRSLHYPRNSKTASAKPFGESADAPGMLTNVLARLFRVLDLMHEALIDGLPVTKRDMFYKDMPLFKTQRVVDCLVDDLAATFELERADLNVRATSKGLICGAGLVIRLQTGDIVHANDTEGSLIPVGEDVQSFSLVQEVSWVLVVEKDAIFQTLCRLRLANHPSLPGCGLIITGKGYPDMATRHLVKTLADNLPGSVPIMALVDGDAYGIDILSVYRYGSTSLQHENAKLAASRLDWLGLWASELEDFGIDRDALIPITKHDEKKALSMLRRPQSVMPPRWRKELMYLLHTRRKAEIEVLSTAKSAHLRSQDGLQDFQTIPSSSRGRDLHGLKIDIMDEPTRPMNTAIHDLLANETSDPASASMRHSRSNPASSTSTTVFNADICSTSSLKGPPLLQYLINKITLFVLSAQDRTAA